MFLKFIFSTRSSIEKKLLFVNFKVGVADIVPCADYYRLAITAC